MIAHRTSLLLIAICTCLLGACRSDSTTDAEQGEEVAVREWLEPVRSMVGVTGRSVLSCPTGECIILHFPPAKVDNKGIEESLHHVPNVTSDDIELIVDANSRWCRLDDEGASASTFNCCTYAVGDVAGLTPDDWVAPDSTGLTCYTVPMQIILDSYYTRVKVYLPPFDGIENDTAIRAEDVLCCVNTEGPLPTFCHAGRISTINGEHRLISKFGAGPLFRTSIKTVTQEYAGAFDEVWVYRARRRSGH